MALAVACPSCGLQGQVDESNVGGHVECPRCRAAVAVAAASAAPRDLQPAVAAPVTAARDAIFAHLGNGAAAAAGHVPVDRPTPLPSAAPPMMRPPAGDLAVERQWLLEERQRLEVYLRRQFEQLQLQRQEFAAFQSKVQSGLVLREQELNRQLKHLAAREAALVEREKAAKDPPLPSESRDVASEEAARLQSVCRQLGQEIENRRRELAAMQTDGGAGAVQAARSEEDARLARRLEEWEGRRRALEEAERAMERRVAEVDEMEERTRRELDERERELVRIVQELQQRQRRPQS